MKNMFKVLLGVAVCCLVMGQAEAFRLKFGSVFIFQGGFSSGETSCNTLAGSNDRKAIASALTGSSTSSYTLGSTARFVADYAGDQKNYLRLHSANSSGALYLCCFKDKGQYTFNNNAVGSIPGAQFTVSGQTMKLAFLEGRGTNDFDKRNGIPADAYKWQLTTNNPQNAWCYELREPNTNVTIQLPVVELFYLKVVYSTHDSAARVGKYLDISTTPSNYYSALPVSFSSNATTVFFERWFFEAGASWAQLQVARYVTTSGGQAPYIQVLGVLANGNIHVTAPGGTTYSRNFTPVQYNPDQLILRYGNDLVCGLILAKEPVDVG